MLANQYVTAWVTQRSLGTLRTGSLGVTLGHSSHSRAFAIHMRDVYNIYGDDEKTSENCGRAYENAFRASSKGRPYFPEHTPQIVDEQGLCIIPLERADARARIF